jgi:xylan 1,4-beta-xylosidase
MPDGQRLLQQLGDLSPHNVYFRTHNLLTTGDGTPALKWGSTNAYTEDAHGNPVYDWTLVDRIFDTYLARGVKPYVQIGFMPKALSTHPDPYQHAWTPTAKYDQIYTGWAYPPKDYAKWGQLVYEWAKHCDQKYGRDEVLKWYWETWNEPNIGYWRGTPDEFLKLHDYATDAVRRAIPDARVGGPDTAGGGGKFLKQFLDHSLHGTNHATGKQGTPLDFISFHAKGSPRFVDGHVRMGLSAQLKTVDETFALIAAYPELKNTPIVLGECDPDGCAACQGPQLGYRNTTMYSSFTAASFARLHDLADKHHVNLEGALTWAFEFEDQPLFAGFRVLSTEGGIDLPVLNVFRMFSHLTGPRLPVTSDSAVPLESITRDGVRATPDVSALATRADGGRIAILLWHYHDDDLPGPDAAVTLSLSRLPAASFKLTHYRIDATHSNAYTTWLNMGSPQSPTPDQQSRLRSAAQLQRLAEPEILPPNQHTLTFPLPRQAVSLLILEPANQ